MKMNHSNPDSVISNNAEEHKTQKIEPVVGSHALQFEPIFMEFQANNHNPYSKNQQNRN